MGSEWPSLPLSNLTAHPATYGIVQPGKHTPDGVPMLRVNNFRDGGFDLGDLRFVSQDVGAKYARTRLREHDVLLTIVGTIGQVGIVHEDLEGWNIARAVALIRPKDKELSDWIGFVLRSPASLARLNVVANTTVQTTVNLKDLRDLPIPLPTRQVRKVIAAILGSLDDKIEANRKMAKTLEAIASAVFKSWFVDFDPVRAKIAGATSWPSMPQAAFDALPTAFVETEIGEVPEGWEVGNIGDVALEVRDPRRADDIADDDVYVGLEHFTRHSLVLWDTGCGQSVTSNKSIFKKGDILFGKLRPYFHKVSIAPSDGICSTDVIVVRPKEVWMHAYAVFSLFQDALITYATNASTGTRMPRTNWKTLATYAQSIPGHQIVASFQSLVMPVLDMMQTLAAESVTLAQTRDTLLPKLISGELRVEEVEEEMEAFA